MHNPHQQVHAALLRIAACLWLLATGLLAQSPAPATQVKPATPPSIPRPVLPPGLQRSSMINPNAVPPAVPGGMNRPGLPAGVTSGPQPVSAANANPKPTTPPPPLLPPATAGAPGPCRARLLSTSGAADGGGCVALGGRRGRRNRRPGPAHRLPGRAAPSVPAWSTA